MKFQPYLIQANVPLFPKALWNRPITKSTAGRLLLVGGHGNEFSVVQEVYQLILACGIGQCTIVLPDNLRPMLPTLDDVYFVPSSPSGSIGKAATAELVQLASEADGLSIGSNLSNNSETAVAVERLLTESGQPRCLYLDALDVVSLSPKLAEDANVCLVVSMPELFRLAGKLGLPLNIQAERGLIGRVELIQSVAATMQASLVCTGKELIVVTSDQTSVTPEINPRLNSAIYAATSVFWTQKSNFEQLTSAAFLIQQISASLAHHDAISVGETIQAIEKSLTAF